MSARGALVALASAALASSPAVRAEPEPGPAAWAPPAFTVRDASPGSGVVAPALPPEPAPWGPPAFTVRDDPAPGSGVVAPALPPEPAPWGPPAFTVRDDPTPGSDVAAPALPPGPRAEDGAEAARDRAVEAARRLLGRPYRSDCSGFVLEAWRAAGIRPRLSPARSRSESLWRATRRVAAPRPGDAAFFHDTYDRNRDGRANDPFSHVALVEAVDGEAVTLLHRGARGIERVRMDLARPSDPAANDPVRLLRKGDRRNLRVLAGELFVGFGALPADRDVAAR